MSRAALTALLATAVGISPLSATPAGPNPHVDPSLVPAGCTACHEGHGAPRSPMLPRPQRAVCLSCHGSRGDLDALVAQGDVASDARPPLLSGVLAQPYVHPISTHAFSQYEVGQVTCTSCHSPHRAMPPGRSATPSGRRSRSSKDANRFEYELCEGCHGSQGVATGSLVDISRLLDPNNRSYHPVEAPSLERSPSVLPRLSGGEINCADCHGNSDARGPRGPHGSSVRYLLRADYVTTDGAPESRSAYALCYGCHDREAILHRSPFPGHDEHLTRVGSSCATCHSAHGSIKNRGLIRFSEEASLAGVSPSASGRLAFVSSAPGAGACFLTCHGKNHDPLSYGTLLAPQSLGRVRGPSGARP